MKCKECLIWQKKRDDLARQNIEVIDYCCANGMESVRSIAPVLGKAFREHIKLMDEECPEGQCILVRHQPILPADTVEVTNMNTDEDNEIENKEILEAEELLKPKLTDEFLDTLVQAANTCNWSVDFIEVGYFVDWCFSVAGKPLPPLDVYNAEENNRRRKAAEINSR